MSIRLQFEMRREGLDETNFLSCITALAREKGYPLEWDGESGSVEFCRHGRLDFLVERDAVRGGCDSSLAGPGFHAAAVDFIEELEDRSGLWAEILDEGGYVEEQDFEALQVCFYGGLWQLLELLELHKNDPVSLHICWSAEGYSPCEVPGTVITPMGRYYVDFLLDWVKSEGIVPFAREFFLWHDRQQDGRFYRNNALNLMWEECCFMFSRRSGEDARVNGAILDLLERAAACDAALPFPKQDYLLLCRLDGRQPVPLEHLPDYQLFDEIGYRKRRVSHRFGNMVVQIPGSYLEKFRPEPAGHVFYDGLEHNWHHIEIYSYLYAQKPQFDQDLMRRDDVRDSITFDVGKGVCKASVFFGDDLAGGRIAAQIIGENQMNLVVIAYENPSEEKWAIGLLKEIRCYQLPVRTIGLEEN